MSDFDEKEVWSDLCSIWRWNSHSKQANEKTEARKIWEKDIAGSESLCLDIRAAADKLNASLADGETYPHRLGGFLRKGWERFVGEIDDSAMTSVVWTPPPAVVSIVYADQTQDSDLAEILSIWPPNPGRPEKPSVARSALDAAVSQHGKERVLKACRSYLTWLADSDSPYPMHLRTFVSDDEEIEIWSAREVPDAGEVAIFDVAWSVFPFRKDEEERKAEGRILFFRNVKPDDRLYFLAACTGYARQMWSAKRRGEGEEQFFLGFARFTREWRQARKGVVWDCASLVEHSLWVVFDREGLDHQGYIKDTQNGVSGFLAANDLGKVPIKQAVSALISRFASGQVRSFIQPWIVRHKDRLGADFDLAKWSMERAEEIEALVRADVLQRAAKL